MTKSAIDINTFEQVGEIHVSPIYYSYPTLYQRHLIPDEALRILDNRWGTGRYVLPSVKFYLLKQVYVLMEGLVFTREGELVEQTRTAHSDADVDTAQVQLDYALATQENIPRHSKAILCKKRGATNYGHWLVEMLPKAYWARKAIGLVDWPVAVHKTSDALQSIICQSLDVIGVPEHQIIVTDRSPVFFEELLVVEGLTSHAVFLSPLVMECMDEIAEKAGSGENENLYVVRRPARSRDFEKEPNIKQVLTEYGYTEIETASLSFLDQVRAFKSARRVAGAMGAALTNIIFCNPGAEILVFMPASALELFFWHLAEGRKLRYHEVRCEETGDQQGSLPWNRLLRIPITEVQTILLRLKKINRNKLHLLKTLNVFAQAVFLTKEQACAESWLLQISTNPSSVYNIQLRADGAVSGYNHHNERSWKIVNGILEFITADGHCSWRLEETAIYNGKLRLRGVYRLDPKHYAVLELQAL